MGLTNLAGSGNFPGPALVQENRRDKTMATDSNFRRETEVILKRRASAPASQEMADILTAEAEKHEGATYERLSNMAATVQGWADDGYDATPDDVNAVLSTLAQVLAHHARVGASA